MTFAAPNKATRRGAIVEGVNMIGLLLGDLAVLVFATVSLLAVGLLIARRTRAARLLFASGLLLATVIAALAVLTFLQAEYRGSEAGSKIVVPALTLLLAGAGQFVAALRASRSYAAALGCALGSLVILTSPFLGDAFRMPTVANLVYAVGFVPLLVASLLLAAASLVLAVLR